MPAWLFWRVATAFLAQGPPRTLLSGWRRWRTATPQEIPHGWLNVCSMISVSLRWAALRLDFHWLYSSLTVVDGSMKELLVSFVV